MGALDQQGAQVAVAVFGDAELGIPVAALSLSGAQAEVGACIAAALEAARSPTVST